MNFISIFVAYQHLLTTIWMGKSYECSEPPAGKQERKTLYYKEIDKRILHK